MHLKTLLFLLFSSILSTLSFNLVAEEYQSSADFINTAFDNHPPKPKSLWVSKGIKAPVTKILQHKPGFMRTRYWRNGDKTVWVLNEIGKTKLISVGIIIENNRISLLKVLAFRESRGWEVKHDFFTDQFKQVALTDDNALDAPIDGISGATLSVQALSKTAQLALFFNQHIQQ
ncbi:MAG: hypothetical protein methR_P1800 [Methyloprofundus sp.]|nr:MAG: hypothetical protein methR_P1800 [Methyloprofundus sp.]